MPSSIITCRVQALTFVLCKGMHKASYPHIVVHWHVRTAAEDMIVKDGGSHSGKWMPCFVRMCALRHDYPRLLSELRPWIQLLSLLLATNIMYRYIIVFGGREGNGSGGRPCPPGYLYFKQSVYAHSHRTYPSFPGSPIMQMTVGDLEQGLQ